MIENLHCQPGGENRDLITEYFRKAGIMLDTEEIEELALQWVPINHGQMRAIFAKVNQFENGGSAEKPYPPNELEPEGKEKKKPVEVPRDPPGEPLTPEQEALWFMKVVCPIPRKGMKRDAYLKNPDTIGSLFEQRHGHTDEAAEARQRLFGFVHHFEPSGWTKRDGTKMPPSETDLQFRDALDAFLAWFETEHPDEKL